MAEVYPIEFPTEYLEAIDEVLVGAAFAGRYNDGAAEFVAGRQISIPDIDFGASPDPTDYNRFASEDGVNINRTVYTLDKDVEKQFYVDALTVQDEPVSAMTGVIAEYERTILAPYIDKHFFEKCVGKARTRATETLSANNIKGEIRKARSQFVSKGLKGWDLYMSSTALGYLEDATDRQWSNEGTILDMVGNYDGFNIFEVPSELLQCDFLAIANGKETAKEIMKRAVNYLFAPGMHTKGDGYLAQMRWVFGNLVRYNKDWGLYCNNAAETAPDIAVGDRNPTPSITLSAHTASIAVAGTKKLTATVVPSDATVTWASSATSKATVSDGTVTGVASGTSNITASITVGNKTYTDKCAVTVTSS